VVKAAVCGAAVAVVFLMGCGGGGEGPTMRPGDNCLGCHANGEARFSAAGTVFGADGAGAAGLTVTLTDSASTQASTTTNSVGNFYFEQTLVAPFQVSITDGTNTAEMPDALNGGCNSCHEAGGSAGGHIVFP
jgi:hypothetical protein